MKRLLQKDKTKTSDFKNFGKDKPPKVFVNGKQIKLIHPTDSSIEERLNSIGTVKTPDGNFIILGELENN